MYNMQYKILRRRLQNGSNACIISVAVSYLKNEKTLLEHKNLTENSVDIEKPCGARLGGMYLTEIKTMSMFGNGKNDRKRRFLTKTPF